VPHRSGGGLRRTPVIKRTSGSSFVEGVRVISPFLVVGIVYLILAAVLKVSYKVWIPVALVAGLGEAIFVLGQLYKPYLVDKKGKCMGSRDGTKANSMARCRHYSPGSQYGGCGHRTELGQCHLRTR
jgi:hypothetical protein